MKNAPITVCPLYRLVGLEVELDPGSAAFHQPTLPDGWKAITDGSIPRGMEYIMTTPLPAIEAATSIKAFSDACIKAKMYASKAGALHVHVQVSDYDHDDAGRLAALYDHYQLVIDRLVAPSRRSPVHNTYCAPLPSRITKDQLVALFNLDRPAANRSEAKGSRHRMVLNFAPLRVSNPLERSIEFRQPSVSKKYINLYGWATFAIGLVELARHQRYARRYIKLKPTLTNFIWMMKRIEKLTGISNLAEWARWRVAYMGGEYSPELPRKLYGLISRGAHGLFYIARGLNINVGTAKRLVENEVEKGNIIKMPTGNKWRAQPCASAASDVETIAALWRAHETPAESESAPQPAPAPQETQELQPA